jgi:2-methylcitrate dehydratase PrpD
VSTDSVKSNATQRLAEMVVGLHADAMPDQTQALMTKCILDWAGVSAGGASLAESASELLAALAEDAGHGTTAVVGRRDTYTEQGGAFLNGTFAHSLELDDTYLPGRLHPGAPCIAAGMAAGQTLGASGPDFLAALLAGYEVSCRLSAALGPGMFSRGLHPTGVAGTFGATATVGKLWGLSVDQLVSAFGLAGSMASGSTQYLHSGSWNKRMHAGLAARNGVFATALARAGVIGATEAFEGEHGVLHAFSDHSVPEPLTADLGTTWQTLTVGIKPYPGCRLTHGAIDASLQMRTRLPGTVPAAAAFTVHLNPDDATIVAGKAQNKFQPRNTVEGQFSVYFQIAAALLHGRPDWTVYELLGNSEVEALARRITAVPDDDIPEAGAILSVHGADLEGEPIRVDTPTGDPATALSWQVIETKFRSLACNVFRDPGLDRIVAAVHALPTGNGTVEELARALQPDDETSAVAKTEEKSA